MMPVNHVQSCVCHVTVLADAGCSCLQSGSTSTSRRNRMLTAGDLTATNVIVNKQFLKVTYSPFNFLKIQSTIRHQLLSQQQMRHFAYFCSIASGESIYGWTPSVSSVPVVHGSPAKWHLLDVVVAEWERSDRLQSAGPWTPLLWWGRRSF